MLRQGLRLGSRLLLAALLVWAARLLSHAKVPEPEGEWREMAPRELAAP